MIQKVHMVDPRSVFVQIKSRRCLNHYSREVTYFVNMKDEMVEEYYFYVFKG